MVRHNESMVKPVFVMNNGEKFVGGIIPEVGCHLAIASILTEEVFTLRDPEGYADGTSIILNCKNISHVEFLDVVD